MRLHDGSITLFNWHERSRRWYTTLFTNVHIEDRASETAMPQSNRIGNDGVTINLPVNPDKSALVTLPGGNSEVHTYMPPLRYAVQESPSGAYTLSPERDFVVLDDLYSAEPLEDRGEEGLYSELNATRDYVFMISSRAFYRLIPHFEIAGR